jgi:palmitoyltransferase
VAIVAVILPYVFLYLACMADPGYVTPDSLAHHMTRYPYDYALFHPGRICQTCNLVKPPRSKHCSICKRCVARSDHHCIFINGCVGYSNHHWFLLLLLSTAAMTTYGSAVGISIVAGPLRHRYTGWTVLFFNSNLNFGTWAAILGRGIHHNLALGSATLLATLISPLIWGLLAYSVWLVYCGTTTNESLKWSEWRQDIAEGYAFARSLPSDRPRDWRYESKWTRWPVEPDRILITTNDGSAPPPNSPIPGAGPWEKMSSMSGVVNIYDLGVWDNLRDIFFIDYPFRKTGEPLARRGEQNSRVKDRKAGHPP